MKKLPYFIVLTVAVSVIAAILLHFLCKKGSCGKKRRVSSGKKISLTPRVSKKFKGFNQNLLLNADVPGAEAEITALQYLINSYYGYNAVVITGVWDTDTADAVRNITGLSGVSLYQFRYYYYVQVRGNDAATAIFNHLTENR